MSRIETDVLIIGGGATGVGVARDLAMRGVEVVLVERGHLGCGTSSRHTGMIHSGTRYVLRDAHTAVECYQENQILRRIAPHCVPDRGAFFIAIPGDDPDYVPRWLDGCRTAGVPVEEIPVGQVLREEPAVNPHILRGFRTPDTTGDPLALIDANADSARQYGACILTYCETLRFVEQQGRVVGAICRDLRRGCDVELRAAMVVNATGVWAGKLTATLNLTVPLLPSKGAMLAFNHRAINRPVGRCHEPSDADAMMPSHSVLLSGSTDGDICDPDDLSINPHHVRIVLQESEKIVPGISATRKLRAWSGVRPLCIGQQSSEDTRRITRSHALLDHEVLDDRPGLVTITGGKWTTYRLMAEQTADLVCEKLDVKRKCRTHLEELPGRDAASRVWLGAALRQVEDASAAPDLVCECELVTRVEVEHSVTQHAACTADDLRRSVRLGMGSCQGGCCGYRAAGLLHALRRSPAGDTRVGLASFLQERWKGVWPLLDGQQLRQMRLNELINGAVLGVDRLSAEQP